MLKFAGCLCILAASTGMAYSYICGLWRELRQMEQLLELLTVMESEITYSRCPLPELLLHLSEHLPQPYRDLSAQCSRRMEDNREADIPALWKDVCEGFLKQLAMPPAAYQILLQTGQVFAYVSLESSLKLLQINRQKLAGLIEKSRAEFTDRRKMYCCLCYVAGLFSIIILL